MNCIRYRRFAPALLAFGLVTAAAARDAAAHPAFVTAVPNSAVYSCQTCHNPDFSRNPFGKVIEPMALASTPQASWWPAVRDLDSDGDGQTNKQELGDPCSTWTIGATPDRTTAISAPGDAASQSNDPDGPGCGTSTSTSTSGAGGSTSTSGAGGSTSTSGAGGSTSTGGAGGSTSTSGAGGSTSTSGSGGGGVGCSGGGDNDGHGHGKGKDGKNGDGKAPKHPGGGGGCSSDDDMNGETEGERILSGSGDAPADGSALSAAQCSFGVPGSGGALGTMVGGLLVLLGARRRRAGAARGAQRTR